MRTNVLVLVLALFVLTDASLVPQSKVGQSKLVQFKRGAGSKVGTHRAVVKNSASEEPAELSLVDAVDAFFVPKKSDNVVLKSYKGKALPAFTAEQYLGFFIC